MTEHTAPSIARELMPAAPPVTVGGMTIYGVPLPDVVLLLTIVYTAGQLIIIAPKVLAVVRKWVKR